MGPRRAFTASFKLKVIKVAEEKGKHFAAKAFGVHRKMVQEWCKNKARLTEAPKTQKKSGGGRPLKYPDIDGGLMAWFQERRSSGVRVTGKSLRREALRMHRENGSQSFKASNGWYRQFKRRHNISLRRTTHVAQHAVELTDERIDRFLRYVTRMRRLREYADSEILNMDETPVWLEMPGKSTLAMEGDNEVRVSSTGHEKDKLTVTLAAYADGTKLSPLVHLPGVRPPKKEDVPTGVIVYMCGSGQKSWANEESIKFWLAKLVGLNNMHRRLLVWDAFRAHITPGVKELVKTRYNSDMAVIPGGCTSKLQPADVSWNRPFKARLSELYDEWVFDGPRDFTRYGNRRPPAKTLVLKWVKEAWATITPEMIRKSFKKCGISSALDGTEDHLFQADDADADSDNGEPFDGFSQEELQMAEQVAENLTEVEETLLSESDESPEPSDIEDSTDPDSDGH